MYRILCTIHIRSTFFQLQTLRFFDKTFDFGACAEFILPITHPPRICPAIFIQPKFSEEEHDNQKNGYH